MTSLNSAAASNSAQQDATARLVSWSRRWSLTSDTAAEARLSAMEVDRFVASLLPDGDIAALDLIAQWTAHICLVDDTLDADTQHELACPLMKSLIHILSATTELKEPETPPLAQAFADLWRRTAPRMTLPCRARFVADYIDYADASRQEAVIRRTKAQVTLTQYLRLRYRTITVLPTLDLIEAITGLPPMENTACKTLIGTVRRTVTELIGWVNDLVSFTADSHAGQNNLVTVMAREHDCSIDSARRRLARAISSGLRAVDADLTTLADRRDGFDQAMMLRRFISAALDWMAYSDRYPETWIHKYEQEPT